MPFLFLVLDFSDSLKESKSLSLLHRKEDGQAQSPFSGNDGRCQGGEVEVLLSSSLQPRVPSLSIDLRI